MWRRMLAAGVTEATDMTDDDRAVSPTGSTATAVEGIGSPAVTLNVPLDRSNHSGAVAAPDWAGNVYLTEQQFCDRYHVAPRTAQRWRVTGEGPPFCRFGRHKITYRLRDIEQWAASRTFRHRAQELVQSMRAATVPNALNRIADSDRSGENNIDSSRARCAPGKLTGEAP
jgi:hypothetical protein